MTDESELHAALRTALRARLPWGGGDDRVSEQRTHDCLAGLDLFALEVPAADQGLELGLSDAVVLCEELGRRAARDEYRPTAMLVDAVRMAGDDRDAHLERIARGELVGAVARGTLRRHASSGPGLVADGRLITADPIERASVLLLLAPVDERPVAATLSLPARGVQLRRNGGGTSELVLESAHLDPLPGFSGNDDDAPGRALLRRARVRQAAYLLGLATTAHHLAVGRVSSRRQFDRPIGDFQAVGFPLAAHVAQLEALALLVRRAARLGDDATGPDADRAAGEALAYAGELALALARDGVHLHGALGMTAASRAGQVYLTAGWEAARWGSPGSLWREVGGSRISAGSGEPR